MNGIELLDRLDEQGLSVKLKGDKLLLTPARLVTEDVVADVSALSGELADLLENPPPAGMTRLMRQLRTGQEWLTTVNDELMRTKTVYGKQVEHWAAALDHWGKLEVTLRGVYDYQGCVLGPGEHCPAESPVMCQACGSATKNDGNAPADHGTGS